MFGKWKAQYSSLSVISKRKIFDYNHLKNPDFNMLLLSCSTKENWKLVEYIILREIEWTDVKNRQILLEATWSDTELWMLKVANKITIY